ncbi:MAG: ATP-grasp domain-containing protein [Trebonia sp.]
MADALLVLGNCSSSAHGADEMSRLAHQAHARGLHVIGADTAGHIAAASSPADEQVILDVYDPHACEAWAQANRGRIKAVFTYREMCVESAAVSAAALGLPGNRPSVIATIRNKDKCRGMLAAAGFPQPEFLLVEAMQEVLAFAARTKPPWIIKPRDGMGSSGIRLARTPDELVSACVETQTSGRSVIETFVDGTEYSAEGIFVDGRPHVLALTAKQTGTGFIEVSHELPAPMEKETHALCEATIKGALRTVDLTHGIFHAEFWLTPNGPVMGEIHARPGGDFLHALVEYIRPGLELFGMALDDSLGRSAARIPSASCNAAIRYLMLPPGRVRSVRGWSKAASHPSVLAANLEVGAGDMLSSPQSSADRHGFIAVGVQRRVEPRVLVNELWRQVEIEVEPCEAGRDELEIIS